jgi:predicted nucleic acid-binding protein
MLFVYWLEDRPPYGARVERIFARMKERGDQLCTSTLAMGEALVGPYKYQNHAMAEAMERFFRSSLVELLPFTAGAAVHYARIRASMSVSRPDATHLACAADAGIDLFLTHDASLVGKTVPGIQFIAGLNTDLF